MMARWLTVLVALVAQGMVLMSPVCFVRCVGADGHECVELAGLGCHCCDCQSPERSPSVCAVATCGHHHEDEGPDEHDAPVEWQVGCEDCSCQHSPLDSAPQVQSKSLSSDGLSPFQVFVPVPMTFDFIAAIQALKFASLRSSLLRPQESPQLAALATVVLRV